jgi:hypothetical protein
VASESLVRLGIVRGRDSGLGALARLKSRVAAVDRFSGLRRERRRIARPSRPRYVFTNT